MVALTLHNATALIATAASGSLFRINDFQGNCLDVPEAGNADFTPVQTYTCNGGNNQMWSLVQISGTVFQISVAYAPGTGILSSQLIGTTLVNNSTFKLVAYQQAMLRTSSAMTFNITSNPNFLGRFNIVPNIPASSQAGVTSTLMSWPKRNLSGPEANDGPSAPLNYGILDLTEVQQAYTFTAL